MPYSVLLPVLLLLLLHTPAFADPSADAQARLAAGQAAFERGAFDTAIESWALAALASERAGDRAGQIQALVHASEAYAMLGRYRQAVGVLDQALKLAESSADRSQVPWILSRLGNLLIATGPADAAEIALKRALDMARESGDTALTVAVLNDFGNFLAMRRRTPEAVAAYRESATLAERAGDASQQSRTRINLARALGQSGNLRAAREALDGELATVERSSPSREASLLLVSIGLGYRDLRAAGPDPGGELLLRAARALNRAREIASQLGDRRTTVLRDGLPRNAVRERAPLRRGAPADARGDVRRAAGARAGGALPLAMAGGAAASEDGRRR